jgi:DNA-directed RNA polymerase subunit L
MELLIKNKSPDFLTFDIKNGDVSFVNALRRIILSELDAYAFETSTYTDSNVKIIENTSSLHNEFLLHRIGLIPVHNISDPTDYKFVLNVQNKTSNVIDVTTKDINVTNLKTNTKEDSQKFFPANPITGDNILIIKLKPNPGEEGEKLHFEGTLSKGTGADNTRYSLVSNVVFTNKVDTEKYQNALDNYLSNIQPENIEKETKTFEINEKERYFYTDESGNPNQFEFAIESIGIQPTHIILKRALEKLVLKMNTFLINFKKSLNKQDSPISIKESPTIMKATDIIIPNETHTLGFLLQSFINKNKSVSYVSYNNPHPLKNEIFIRISTDSDLKTILEEVCNELTDVSNQFIKQINNEFGVNIMAAKKIKIIRKKKAFK